MGADKPLVLGTTDDEFTMVTGRAEGTLRFVPPMLALGGVGLSRATRHAYLAANRPQVRKGTAALIGRFVTDHVFRTDVVRIADARGDAATWAYRFSWPSPTRTWALHCLDVPFWFDCLDAPGVATLAGDAPPRGLAAAVHGAAAAFVRDGEPGWAQWKGGTTRVFGGDPSQPETAARRLRERARAGLIRRMPGSPHGAPMSDDPRPAGRGSSLSSCGYFTVIFVCSIGMVRRASAFSCTHVDQVPLARPLRV